MNIRKLIAEEIEKLINKDQVEKQFDQDITYLKGFHLNKKEDKGNSIVWIFDHKQKDYIIRFYVEKNKNKETWKCKIFIYWKQPSKNFTNAKGKDFEDSYGPFLSYEEMVKELNRKLENHPNLSKEIFLDDNGTLLNKDVIEMIKVMLKKKDKIDLVKNEHFTDLKKLLNKTRDIKTINELRDFVDKEAPDDEDKQTLLLIIQKIYQLDFYLSQEKIDSLF